MNKSLIAAAAFAALALGTAGTANAAVGGFGGVRAAAPASELAQQVHWRPHYHRHKKTKHCVWRRGHQRCWWN